MSSVTMRITGKTAQPWRLFVDPRTDLYTVGLTTEVIFHSKKNNGFQQVSADLLVQQWGIMT